MPSATMPAMRRWNAVAVAIAACSATPPGPADSRVEADVAGFFEAGRQAQLGEQMICGGERYASDRYALVGKPSIRERGGDHATARVRVRMTVELATTTDRVVRIGTRCDVTRDLYYRARGHDWALESWFGIVP